MATPEETAGNRLREIQNRYTERLRENLTLICDGVQDLLLSEWDPAAAENIVGTAHQTAGSAPTFGFEEQGFYCRLLETLLKGILAEGSAPGEGPLGEMRELHKFLVRVLSGLGTGELPLLPADAVRNKSPAGGGIYFLSGGDADSDALARQLNFYGHDPVLFATLEELEAALARARPAALIAHIQFSREPSPGLLNIIRWRQETPHPVPVIFISDRDDFEARLQAVHVGGFAFFKRPLDGKSMNALLDRLDELTGTADPHGLRVQIIEDDPILAEYYALILDRAGIVTTITLDLSNFTEDVAAFEPDLVLMDLYLQGTLGTDLALVLGQHERFRHIPVIFLSSERNRDLQIQALEAGADNFLVKPIHPGHLVLALRSRALRGRFQQEVARRDGLTGLLAHVQIKEELGRALNYYDDCVIAMIDIDFFKGINDTHGHATGDQVIRSLARLLKARLRGEASLGRYGGEEFLVIMPETDPAGALSRLDALREEFGRIDFPGESGDFRVSFSGGMVQSDQADSAAALLELADQALYRAKKAGRNKVFQSP